ncbi:MAG: peptidase dimerization domain-containing protein [Dehalococcoidia bacterium]|nr:peptidase dimerization domain-containing protein [Dehalococcoidia bacterium]
MFINTLNITMLNSGIKANVIPAKSEAVIDCRILPGQFHRRMGRRGEARHR